MLKTEDEIKSAPFLAHSFPSSDHFAVDISWHHQCLWGLPRTWNVYTSTVEEKLSVLRVSNGWDFLSLLFSEKISCVILQLISIKTKLGKCNYKVLWHSIDLFSTEKIVFFLELVLGLLNWSNILMIRYKYN